jgi:cytochrome P450
VEDVTVGPKLNTCVYLRACIEESLRMAPPAPGGFPREVCKGGATIDGHVIPAEANVFVPTWTIHHNPEYFPKPFTYRPERWIVNDGEEGKDLGVSKAEVQKAQKAFCAFSLGPRGCLGKNMAYIEMMLAIARVLFMFDIKSAGTLGEGTPGPNEWDRKDVYQMRESFTARKDGPLIKFVERDS